ncbi:hypothetical protein ACQF36_08825 [Streptomyces sp. Marseille-Q5077]|uniref:hypothetical protein n=1 Tax=Streptomyces sp. Marseille-Q5077 TaxID=3418995 RepID=UPI003CFE7988
MKVRGPAGAGGKADVRDVGVPGPPAASGWHARVGSLLALSAVTAALLTGCGIRSTEVPTNFGPAPSRVHCSLSEPNVSTQATRGLPVQVFLLCGSQLVAVDRTVRVTDGTADSARRVLVAQGLLDELEATPSAAEKEAGYTTDVRGAMAVSGPHPGDPDETLRLSTPPNDLTSYALAQIVCTFSDSTAAEGDGSVILGGPGTEPLRRYECTDEVRTRPGSNEPPSTEITDN